jgi:O-antigen ligase
MIRLSLLALYILVFSALAFKKWFWSLCALILLMAVIEHPDMPKTIFGLQGLNPWNLLLLAVVAGWAINRSKEGLEWDLPAPVTFLLLLYLGVVLVSFARMMADRVYIEDSATSLTSEYLINTIKWVIPGLLLYDGARTRRRFRLALFSALGVYVLLGIQVIKWMPLASAMDGDTLSTRSLKILINEVGYHRVNMSAMLAGATWAVFALRPLGTTNRQRLAAMATTGMLLLAQVLTAGRAGYATSALVCLVLCVLKWRRYLLLFPVVLLTIVIAVPGVAERFTEGFTSATQAVPTRIQQLEGAHDGPDAYTITAGRSLIWPFVIEKIAQAPWVGYGRLGMIRTGLASFLATSLDEGFSHPHNAYLEMLLDNGIVGFVLVMPFYGLVLWYAVDLFKDRRSPAFEAIGGATLAFVMGLLVSSMGSQSFYPTEGWLGMWCLIFLMLRVRVQRAHVLAAQQTVEVRRFVPRLVPAAAAPALAAAGPSEAPVPSASSGVPPLSRFGVRLRVPPAAVTIDEAALWRPADLDGDRHAPTVTERLRSMPVKVLRSGTR